MGNLDLYNQFRSVPQEARKTIGAGRLKGFTDINPMWRIKKLTEAFGPCGFGWYIEDVQYWTERSESQNTAVIFCKATMRVKVAGEWSAPIIGVGGSSLIASEKNGLYLSDEAAKMAYTDAISICCKNLGMAADIYFEKDRTKYDIPQAAPASTPIPAPSKPALSPALMDKVIARIAAGEVDVYNKTLNAFAVTPQQAQSLQQVYNQVTI